MQTPLLTGRCSDSSGVFLSLFLICRMGYITWKSFTCIQTANSLSGAIWLLSTSETTLGTEDRSERWWPLWVTKRSRDWALRLQCSMSSPSWVRQNYPHLPSQGSANHMDPVTLDTAGSAYWPQVRALPTAVWNTPKAHLPLLLQGGISSGRVPREHLATSVPCGPTALENGSERIERQWPLPRDAPRYSSFKYLEPAPNSLDTLQPKSRPTEAIGTSDSVAYPRDGSVSVLEPKESFGKSAGHRAFSHADQMEAVPGDILSHPHPHTYQWTPWHHWLRMHRHHRCPAHLGPLPAQLPPANEQASVNRMPQ